MPCHDRRAPGGVKVRFTDSSERNFEAIADYLGRDDPAFALRFVSSLRQSCREIGKRPNLYPIAEGIGPGNLRRRLVSPYLIVYRVEHGAVFIHGVVHGARNIEQIFADLPR